MLEGRPARRVAMVIGLRPECEARYRELHAHPWPAVLDRITRSNVRDFSIHLARLGGEVFLFGRFLYVGDDLDADMAAMAADPETQRWWRETDPCQRPLDPPPPGERGTWWTVLEEVFHHP
jgi:L-rhamnose mutarotase